MNQSGTGNPQDLGSLLEVQRLPLTRYVARILGDPDGARDVVQDAFVKLVARRAGGDRTHEVEWLFTVCRNGAFDILRREGRMKSWDEGAIGRIEGAEPRPGSALEQSEARVAALGLVAKLPLKQQEVLRLKFQNGFSYKEIARITGLSVSHVGVLIHAALARLRSDWGALPEGAR